MICFLGFLTGTPFAALTGTADAVTCSVIVSKLSLKKPLTIQVSPNRENLRFAVISEKKDVIFFKLDWLVYHIREKGETADKTVIFCNTMNDIASVVNYLMMKLGKDAYSPRVTETARLSSWDFPLKLLAPKQGKGCAVF